MQLDHALDFARRNRQAVLVTMKRDGRPQLSNVLQRVGDDGVVRELVGEHDDWDEYRRSMVTDRRVVARFRPERAYGLLADPS